jgi:hypothetical protein
MTKLVLSEGHITPDSPISVSLIKNHNPDAVPIIVITWPIHVTQCTPSKLAEVVGNACRLLGNANLELARRRIIQPGSE